MNAKDLTAKYAVKEPTFEVSLGDDTLILKSLSDVAGIVALKKKARKLMEVMAKNAPNPWKPFLPLDEETALIVVEMSALVIEPPFTQLEAVEFARTAGPAASFLHSQILLHLAGSVARGEMEALEEAGGSIRSDDLWRAYLTIGRDALRKHPEQFDEDDWRYARDFLKLRLWEIDQMPKE